MNLDECLETFEMGQPLRAQRECGYTSPQVFARMVQRGDLWPHAAHVAEFLGGRCTFAEFTRRTSTDPQAEIDAKEKRQKHFHEGKL